MFLLADGVTDASRASGRGRGRTRRGVTGAAAAGITNTPVKLHLADGEVSALAATFGEGLALEPGRFGYTKPTDAVALLQALTELVGSDHFSAAELAGSEDLEELDPEADVSLEAYLERSILLSARRLLALLATAVHSNPTPFAPLASPLRTALAGDDLDEDTRCRAIGLLATLNFRSAADGPLLDA